FNDTATTEIYTTTDTLSLHDALPIYDRHARLQRHTRLQLLPARAQMALDHRSEEHTSELQSPVVISYVVFCLKKKKSYTLNTILPRATSPKVSRTTHSRT